MAERTTGLDRAEAAFLVLAFVAIGFLIALAI
jgi:hypothetical protein